MADFFIGASYAGPMKMFYAMMVLMLLGALALPFFMEGPNGKPIMTMDKMVGESVTSLIPSEPVEMYRWQDEHGVWQFGERAPEQAPSAMMSVDHSRTNSMGAEWDVTNLVSQSGSSDPVNFKMPNSLTDAYRAAPELMGATQRAAKAMNGRQADMDDLLERLHQNFQ